MLALVVVVMQIFSEFFAKRVEVFEGIALVKLLLGCSMKTLNLAILRGLAGVNEIVRDAEHTAIEVKSVYPWVRWVRALFVSRVVVSECGVIVCLYSGDGKRRPLHHSV